MIVGHLGVAAAGARWRPHRSLPWLVVVAISPDLLDIGYALAGVCNPYGLYSHTVPAALLLGACLTGITVLAGRRDLAAIVLLLVLLHLPLDYPTGRKLFWPGGEMQGLDYYDRPLIDFMMESVLLLAGWTVLRGRAGAPRWATSVWTVVVLLLFQGGLDAFRHGSLKPNACPIISPAPVPAR